MGCSVREKTFMSSSHFRSILFSGCGRTHNIRVRLTFSLSHTQTEIQAYTDSVSVLARPQSSDFSFFFFFGEWEHLCTLNGMLWLLSCHYSGDKTSWCNYFCVRWRFFFFCNTPSRRWCHCSVCQALSRASWNDVSQLDDQSVAPTQVAFHIGPLTLRVT